jgi:PAS domain S-box-containing protein
VPAALSERSANALRTASAAQDPQHAGAGLLTERTRRQLAPAQRRHHELFDNVVVGLLRSTPGAAGAFIDVNPAMVRMFEADNREQLMALHPSEIYLDPSQRRLVTDEITTQGFTKGKEVRFKTLKGRPIWGRITSIKHADASGQVYFDSTIEDITERKRAEETLQRASRYDRRLIEASLDPLVTIGPDGRITDVNAATEAITGCRREGLAGTDFSGYFTGPRGPGQAINRSSARGW